MFKTETLDNGLRIVTEKLENTGAVTVLVLVGAGSRYEEQEIRGISHFLEHMFFKGAKKYPTAAQVSEAIDSVGGEFNAFTGKEYAGYYVKVALKNKHVAFDVLSDMLVHSKFEQEEIEKERGVILEEYNMYQDTPMYQTGWNFERLMYGDQPLGWDQIGTKELIKSVNHEDFVDYKNKLYTPDNTIIAVAGNVDHSDVVEEVKKYFTFDDGKKAYNFDPIADVKEEKRIMLTEKKTEQAHLVLGVEAYAAEHKDHFALKLLSVILGGNMSSRMFLNIREAKGLSYYIQTSTDDYLDSGLISTRAGVDINRAKEAVECIRDEYLRIASEPVSEKELQKGKDYLKGKIVLNFEDSEEVAHFYAKQFLLYSKMNSLEEVFAEIDKVTVDDISRISKELFQLERMKLVVIGPFSEEEYFMEALR